MNYFDYSFLCQLSQWHKQGRKKRYDFKFKQAVIKDAKENSIQEAARKYSVGETGAFI